MAQVPQHTTDVVRDGEAVPVVCHLAAPDAEPSRWLDEHLALVAPQHATAKFVRVACSDGGAPRCLPFVRSLPALLLVEGGVVVDCTERPAELREPRELAAYVDGWLDEQLLQRRKRANSDDEDSDEEDASYCGRPGCRRYPHEHVAWGKRVE